MEVRSVPKFTDTPPTDPRGHALPIIRTPAQKKFQIVLTAPTMIGTNTHFWGGKTVPCETPECPACQKGVPYRWHAYTSGVLQPNNLHVIYELTALASENLVTYRKNHGTLRGCLVSAYRWRGAPNGRIVLKCEPCAQPVETLPTPPDLVTCLSIIWQLPLPAVSTSGQYAGADHVQATREELNSLAFPIERNPEDQSA